MRIAVLLGFFDLLFFLLTLCNTKLCVKFFTILPVALDFILWSLTTPAVTQSGCVGGSRLYKCSRLMSDKILNSQHNLHMVRFQNSSIKKISVSRFDLSDLILSTSTGMPV